MDGDQAIVNGIIRTLKRQWEAVNTVSFPRCRIVDTGDAAAPYRAELYYNADEKVITFTFDPAGNRTASGETVNIAPDTHYTLIPVYAEMHLIPHGLLLTFTTSGNLYYAHGRINDKHVEYYHCPQCNGFIAGLPEGVKQTRQGFQGTGFYCRRCEMELTFNPALLVQEWKRGDHP